jgi:hypothetical protein
MLGYTTTSCTKNIIVPECLYNIKLFRGPDGITPVYLYFTVGTSGNLPQVPPLPQRTPIRHYWEEKKLADKTAKNTELNKNIATGNQTYNHRG